MSENPENVPTTCAACGGRGIVPGDPAGNTAWDLCQRCQGTGVVGYVAGPDEIGPSKAESASPKARASKPTASPKRLRP